MKPKTFDDETWTSYITRYGFIRGYAVIALKAVFLACNNRRLIESHHRRIEQRKQYFSGYYEQNRERILQYHRDWRNANLEEQRAKRREYYYRNREAINEKRKAKAGCM